MGSGKNTIWMPLYIGDILVDTVQMTTEQFGAYVLLLLYLWARGTLLDNDEMMARITGYSRKDWKRNRAALAQNFTVADGLWTSSYIDRERARATMIQEQNTKRAHAGARARWNKPELPEPPLSPQLPPEPPSVRSAAVPSSGGSSAAPKTGAGNRFASAYTFPDWFKEGIGIVSS